MIKYFSGYLTSSFLKRRIKNIEFFMRYPMESQMNLMQNLILYAKDTKFGKKYGFSNIKKYQQFSERVPISDYSILNSDIKKIIRGEKNILWPGKIKWFAKSSGTTSHKSKYIPITNLSMNNCHYKAGKDMLSIYLNNHPNTKILFGKAIRLGGSYELENKYNTFHGDLSSILIKNMPFWADFICVPNKKISLTSKWEQKIDKIIKSTNKQDVRFIFGVCSWILLFLNKLVEYEQNNIYKIWPNFEVIFHGGVSLKPYFIQYEKIFQEKSINYYDIYSASEGFFAIQDRSKFKDLLLLLNHGIFYEFIPIKEIKKKNPKIITIDNVELHKNYVLVISTNSGLWRYIVGDIIQFTNLYPYRIIISGRTKQYINTFGEELISDNTDKAISNACELTHSILNEYTVGPIYMNNGKSGSHQWIIEFQTPPDNIKQFIQILDKELKKVNSDYEIKRYKNMILKEPIVHIAREGLFYDWMKKNKKLGGQNKIPRLSNDRIYIDSIMNMENI